MIGVLVANLGTPDSPTPEAVRTFLREFLSDPEVVDLPRWVWRPLLELVILRRRAPRVAEAYASIWTDRGSPLAVHTSDAGAALGTSLGDGWVVAVGMRYGDPSLADALGELVAAGCGRIVLLPLFPQWSATTSGTLEGAVARELALLPTAPELAVVPAFPDDAGYVDALAHRYREAVGDEPVDQALFSFHGLPVRYVRRGDPYADHCRRTARALADRLALPDDRWRTVYQSRFGPERWLEPFLEDTLRELGPSGGRVAVVLPGFAADCLETLEEVGERGRDAFLEAGGRELVVVPALNASPPWVAALASLARRAAREAGW